MPNLRVWLSDNALAAQDPSAYPFSLPIMFDGGFEVV